LAREGERRVACGRDIRECQRNSARDAGAAAKVYIASNRGIAAATQIDRLVSHYRTRYGSTTVVFNGAGVVDLPSGIGILRIVRDRARVRDLCSGIVGDGAGLKDIACT
jgi:hypothetical protein